MGLLGRWIIKIIIGVSGSGLAQIKAIMAKTGHEVVVMSNDEIKESNKTIGPIYFVNLHVDPCVDEHISIQKKDNAFRGGSRGKGGKTKYARK